MKSLVYQCLFFIIIYIRSTYHYPTGAPASTCASMTPQHGVNSQACSSNYIVQSDKTQYYTNDTILITVSGATSSDTFRGVLIIAKTADTSQIIGNWSVSDSNLQTLACGNIANTGVTHTSNNDKSSVTATWTPPSTVSTANTVIRVTVVKTHDTIYVGCFSVTLMNKQNIQSSNGTTTTAGTGTGTGVTRSSTSLPSTITIPTTTVPSTSTVGLNTSWTFANGITTATMKITNLQTSQWLAVGLSLDQSMGNDHVFLCKRLSNDTVTIERLINPGGHVPPVSISTVSNPGGTFTVTSTRLVDGVIYCQFTLSGFSNSKRRKRDVTPLTQTTSYYPLIAIGNLDSSDQLIQHTSALALSNKVQLNQPTYIVEGIDASPSPTLALIKAHGIIMIFAWILFASTGILSARYFKPTWPEKKLGGKAIWFVIHRPVMISVVVLTLIAFGLILIYEKGTWIPKDEPKEFAHSIVGIIVISFAVIQPFMALLRCKPDAKYRFIFNYAHRFVGLSALLLSIVTIFIAVFFSSPTLNLQNSGAWGILVAWTCWIFFVFITFWLIDYYFDNTISPEKPPESYNLGSPTASEDNLVLSPHKILQDRIKLGLLIVHILIALGLAIGLAIMVGNT